MLSLFTQKQWHDLWHDPNPPVVVVKAAPKRCLYEGAHKLETW